jgi:hypothetical protein
MQYWKAVKETSHGALFADSCRSALQKAGCGDSSGKSLVFHYRFDGRLFTRRHASAHAPLGLFPHRIRRIAFAGADAPYPRNYSSPC